MTETRYKDWDWKLLAGRVYDKDVQAPDIEAAQLAVSMDIRDEAKRIVGLLALILLCMCIAGAVGFVSVMWGIVTP